MTISEMKERYTCGLFATLDSIEEAVEFASDIVFSTSKQKDRIYGYTAIQVLLNTALNECEKRELKEIT